MTRPYYEHGGIVLYNADSPPTTETHRMEFHPLAEDYPLMSAFDLGRLEQGMRERGFDPRFPIVLYEDKILDGRNRQLCADAASIEAKYTTFRGTEEQARWFVITANEERRHLEKDWLQKRREERIGRVAEARKSGQSIRTIAETENVSVGQVQRDLEESSGVSGGDTPEMEEPKVTGRDGKQYPAAKPQPPEGLSKEASSLLAKHKIKSNEEQLSALARYTEETQLALAESVADKRQTLDQAVSSGEVPDPTVEETIKEVNGRIESFCRKLTALATEECPDDFWLTYQGRRDVFLQKIKDCCSQLRGGKCHSVCPKCEGAGCKVCVQTGRLPRLQYDQVA